MIIFLSLWGVFLVVLSWLLFVPSGVLTSIYKNIYSSSSHLASLLIFTVFHPLQTYHTDASGFESATLRMNHWFPTPFFSPVPYISELQGTYCTQSCSLLLSALGRAVIMATDDWYRGRAPFTGIQIKYWSLLKQTTCTSQKWTSSSGRGTVWSFHKRNSCVCPVWCSWTQSSGGQRCVYV